MPRFGGLADYESAPVVPSMSMMVYERRLQDGIDSRRPPETPTVCDMDGIANRLVAWWEAAAPEADW